MLAAEVRPLVIERIQTVFHRYQGRVPSWDVVNEAILPNDGQAGSLRKSFWYEAIGPGYIDLAFRTVRLDRCVVAENRANIIKVASLVGIDSWDDPWDC